MDPRRQPALPSEPRPHSYPPPGHVLRHLRIRLDARTEGTVTAAMPILEDLVDHTGALRIGVLATFTDYVLGVLSTQAATPDWIATHDLGIQLLGEARGHEVTASGRLVRDGRNTLVSDLVIWDGPTVVAASTTTYSRLERVGPSGPIKPLRRLVDLTEPDEARRTTLDRYLGFDVDPAGGTLRFEHLPHLRNSTGAIQGGVIAIAMEWLAAELAGRAVGRPGPGRTTQLQVYYLSQGRQPPFVVRGQTLGSDGGPARESLHRLELIEEPTGRLLALGTARAQG